MIGPLNGIVVGTLVGEITDIRTGILAGVCMIMAVVVAIASNCVGSIVYALDVWAGVCTGTVFNTDVSIVVLIDALASEVKDVVSGIGASTDADATLWVTMKVGFMKFRTLLAPLDELLLFWWTVFCCWPIALVGRRTLQAWMPSYHV